MSRLRNALVAALSAALAASTMVVPTLAPTASAAPTTEQDALVLKYTAAAPLNRWQEESLPIGNGALGASIFGQVANDEVFLNEKTLWTGGPGVPGYRYGNYPESEIPQRRTNLQTVRDRINANGSMGAGEVARLLGQPKLGYGNYQSFGKLMFAFNNGTGTPTNYERSLDIDNSIAKVTYAVDGTTFTREYFASYPDNVIVMKISADKPGKVNFTTTYDRKLQSGIAADEQALSSGTVTAVDGRITLQGTSPNNGLAYNAQADVDTEGGTVTSSGPSVTVANADSATIVWSAGTNYGAKYDPDITKSYRNGDTPAQVAAKVTARVDGAQDKGWNAALAAHQADYKAIYERVKLDLNGAPLTTPTNTARSAYRGTSAQDRTLETMYYQYGRYLMISSSRDFVLGAANLQGVWNERNNPPWSADYHTNINVQMNYWPALSGNMPETYDAYLDYITSLVGAGEVSAKNIFGYDNTWMVMNETTPWGFTGVFDWSTAFWFPDANAWLAQAFYWKYLYTGDEEFLRNEAYPMLKKTANFWTQYLVEDPRDGTLVANPSYSPEHGDFTAGAAMTQQIAVELFQSTIEAAEILGLESEVTGIQAKLDDTYHGLEISPTTGMLREWKNSDALGEIGHRHVSHLYALWPGRNISANTTPELAEAARKSLNHRGDGGTGWSMAWKINFWAKLFDGDRAHTMVRNIIMNSTYPNLWDAHPPFQIDGNFGATSGINEMLVANDPGVVTVLPALPTAWAGQGSFDGIKAWNDVTVGATWASGLPTEIRIDTANAGPVQVKTDVASAPLQVTDAAGTVVAHTVADGMVKFTAAAGGEYRIAPTASLTVDAPESMEYSSDATVSVNVEGAPAGSQVVVDAPEGWQVSPSAQWVAEGDSTVTFTVRATNGGTSGALNVSLVSADYTVPAAVQIGLVDPAVIAIDGVAAWDSSEPHEGAGNGYPTAAVDGDPNSFWHTQWDGANPTHPHYLVIDLGEEKEINSLTYLPRPKSACGSSIFPTACNGQIVGYEISAATGGTWVEPTEAQLRQRTYAEPADATYTVLKTGNFDSTNTNPKTVTFDRPVTTRYLKIKSTSAVGGQAWAHIAELQVRGAAATDPAPLEDPAIQARIQVAPATVDAGAEVTVTGGGFAAGEAVTVKAGTATATATANANGFISAKLTIPASQAAGQLTVTATQGTTTASSTLTVRATTPPADTTAPVITAIGTQSGQVGTAVSVQVRATDPSTPLVYSATGLPAGVSISPSTGLISGTPTAAGTFNPVITVTDAKGNKSTATFAWSVAAAPVDPVDPDTEGPVVAQVPAVTGFEGRPVRVQVRATDASAPLTFTAVGLPKGVTINASTGLISGVASVYGTFNVEVTVTDGAGNATVMKFPINLARKPYEFKRTIPYTTPGAHLVNGRQWLTSCEPYSQTERCRTEIWASVVKRTGNSYSIERGWAFNNLTYLPMMTRAQWAGNPLGYAGQWTASDESKWRTECDTALTGGNACRSFRWTTVYNATPAPGGGYVFGQENKWVFNNIVMFRPW